MANIVDPLGGWEQYANIYEYYEGAGNLPVRQTIEFGANIDPLTEVVLSVRVDVNVLIEDYGGSRRGLLVEPKFVDYFEKNGAKFTIKYRDRKTLEIKTANGFSELPFDPKTCDIIEFNPPGELSAQIIYKPTITYRKYDPLNPGLPGTVQNTSKTYIQTLHGSYQGWANKLKDYINKSGPFPRI
ncbi:hypothetical protein Ah1_00213 [Aeromonas phage Ah1]|uniref:Uncharacterized protein n=1 Tax=Aeromonas phage Ah1 TaxID=2053701 RepID=A0A2H4YEY7_9CAUD|nr:hypothetical protein KNT77_gp305 [Aeromonas phage Ah1]AUE22731.1 hypothetical protein Ah1_00213 [Aeromonas phage Ah1]